LGNLRRPHSSLPIDTPHVSRQHSDSLSKRYFALHYHKYLESICTIYRNAVLNYQQKPIRLADVRIEINTDSSQNYHLHGIIDPNAFMLMVPKMDIGEAYPIEVTQFRRDDGTKLDPVTTRPENIKIWSDTPHGRGFWYGRITDAMAVLPYQTLPCDLGDLVHHHNPRPHALQGSK
jgi:hypothetical protein